VRAEKRILELLFRIGAVTDARGLSRIQADSL
jgi:hypothetical protein